MHLRWAGVVVCYCCSIGNCFLVNVLFLFNFQVYAGVFVYLHLWLNALFAGDVKWKLCYNKMGSEEWCFYMKAMRGTPVQLVLNLEIFKSNFEYTKKYTKEFCIEEQVISNNKFWQKAYRKKSMSKVIAMPTISLPTFRLVIKSKAKVREIWKILQEMAH